MIIKLIPDRVFNMNDIKFDRISDLIGEGNFAKVFRCDVNGIEQKLAIKIITLDLEES